MTQHVTDIVTVREAVGVFHSWDDLQAAVDRLLADGFNRSDLSLLASEKVCAEKLGHVYTGVRDLQDDPAAPRRPFTDRDDIVEGKAAALGVVGYLGAAVAIGAIIASGGTLVAAIAGAVAAGGGGLLVGTRLARLIGREHAHSIDAQLRKGGILLWVIANTEEQEAKAIAALKAFGAEDVHIHSIREIAEPEYDPLVDAQPDPFLPGART